MTQQEMIGTTIKHYEVVSQLGKGGMGVVYRARDTRLNRPVALKVLKSELVSDPDRRLRFVREARAAAAITHSAIAQIYDVDEEDGTIFIAMELVEGRTLRELIAGQELDLQSSIEVAVQVSDGLAKAHDKGIVHRDIKSDNIMVTPDGHGKILDFGLAKLLDPSVGEGQHITDRATVETVAQTQLGVVMGTIAYMSPEQARGRPVDQASDVFSMGVVVYEMVTGELPFKGGSPVDTMHAIAFEEVQPITEVRKHLPSDLHRIVTRCLRKKPEDRYSDAKALADDLRHLKQGLDSGVQRSLPVDERIRRGLDWLGDVVPTGRTGRIAAVVLFVLVVSLLVIDAGIGTLVMLTIPGLLIYRWVRNRRNRLLKRFVSRVRNLTEVQAIVVRDSRITVIVDKAQARVYVRVNNLVEKSNGKLFHGEPFDAVVRDDLNEAQLLETLREPGVAYVRKDILTGS
jgi:serine/threonine protein kinase